MVIVCPNCNLSKELGEVHIPPRGAVAICPRCRTQFRVKPERQGPWFIRRKASLAMLLFLAGIVSVLSAHDWKLDKDYFLQPGIWQGEMTYLGKKHPFVLVIEKAQDGKMAGYMDWVESSPKYRLAVRGTYVGNHLLFEDYAFIEGQGASGLNDKKDVYIIRNEMVGTDKNGNAKFHALKRE